MAQRRLNVSNLVTITSVAILVGTEILGAVLAAAYALGSLLAFERELLYGLIGLALLLGLWLIWKFTIIANRAEPIFEE